MPPVNASIALVAVILSEYGVDSLGILLGEDASITTSVVKGVADQTVPEVAPVRIWRYRSGLRHLTVRSRVTEREMIVTSSRYGEPYTFSDRASRGPFWIRSEERRVGKECRSRWSAY